MKAIVPILIGALLGSAAVLPLVGADEDDRYSPVHTILRAAREGDATLKALLAKGVDINATDEDGETALMEAADSRRYTEALRVLIANGANVNQADEDGETALMRAADEGTVEAVRLLLQAGANPAARDEDGETALDKAIDEGNREVINLLRAQ